MMDVVEAKREADSSAEETLARSKLYLLFAHGLSHPSEEILQAFVSGEFFKEVEALTSCAGYDVAINPSEGLVISNEEIEVSYASAFEAGLPKVSLREANYIREGEKILFEDLFRFYDLFGLDTSSGALREWPDHVAVELEFMHYLVHLENATPIDMGSDAGAIRRAEYDFLVRHIAHWVDELASRLEEKMEGALFPSVARALATFVTSEVVRLKPAL